MDRLRRPPGREELTRLDNLLQARNAPMRLAGVQGMLTAIASAPMLVQPSAWYPHVLGDGDFTTEEVEEIVGLLLRMWNGTLTDLNGGAEIPDLEEGFQDDDSLAEWCQGYLGGARLDEVWRADDQAVTMMVPFFILSDGLPFLGEKDAHDEVITDQSKQKNIARGDVVKHVAELHAYWNAWRRERMKSAGDRLATAKRTGRNEPCPCGSGKKYKRCCGAA